MILNKMKEINNKIKELEIIYINLKYELLELEKELKLYEHNLMAKISDEEGDNLKKKYTNELKRKLELQKRLQEDLDYQSKTFLVKDKNKENELRLIEINVLKREFEIEKLMEEIKNGTGYK